jgi:hypothetical protein
MRSSAAKATGELFAGDTVFAALERAGRIAIHAAHASSAQSAVAVKILRRAPRIDVRV